MNILFTIISWRLLVVSRERLLLSFLGRVNQGFESISLSKEGETRQIFWMEKATDHEKG